MSKRLGFENLRKWPFAIFAAATLSLGVLPTASALHDDQCYRYPMAENLVDCGSEFQHNINWFMWEFCGGDRTSDCTNAVVELYRELRQSVAAAVCPPDGIISDCQRIAEEAMNAALRALCPPAGSPADCEALALGVVADISAIVQNALRPACPPTGATGDCVTAGLRAFGDVVDTVDGAVQAACPPSGSVASCQSRVEGLVAQTLRLVCRPSGSVDDCSNELLALVADGQGIVGAVQRAGCPPSGSAGDCMHHVPAVVVPEPPGPGTCLVNHPGIQVTVEPVPGQSGSLVVPLGPVSATVPGFTFEALGRKVEQGPTPVTVPLEPVVIPYETPGTTNGGVNTGPIVFCLT